ncbi:MAG: hydrogenase [Candidatus Xenobium sp.]|jgi:hydrogenase-4 component E|nr:hydrogenase [Burkholderiales bacterium]
MKGFVDFLLVSMILTNLWVLGSSRLPSCIRALAFQGVAVGLLPFALYPDHITWDLLMLALLSITLKAVVFPHLLRRAMLEARVDPQVEPFVGHGVSVVIGMAALALSVALFRRHPLPIVPPSDLLMPVAVSTLLVGLFMLIARRKALTQALGYLVFENGIQAFGLGVLKHAPLMVELGILLDVFFAVFVMGITIFHIRRAFATLDTMEMAELRG